VVLESVASWSKGFLVRRKRAVAGRRWRVAVGVGLFVAGVVPALALGRHVAGPAATVTPFVTCTKVPTYNSEPDRVSRGP
jgi:hypothetical protein